MLLRLSDACAMLADAFPEYQVICEQNYGGDNIRLVDPASGANRLVVVGLHLHRYQTSAAIVRLVTEIQEELVATDLLGARPEQPLAI